ncbi:MAG TPA: hypothetical protein VHE79_05435 [Spirochaetia bacterium]
MARYFFDAPFWMEEPMNRLIAVNRDRRTVCEGGDKDDTRGDRSASAGTKTHAVVPGSLQLGEVVSTATSEKIEFELTLLDGRTLRGRIALRVVVAASLVKVYPSVIILAVHHAPE